MAEALYQVFERGISLRSPDIGVYVDLVQRGAAAPSWADASGPIETIVPQTMTIGTNGKESLLKIGYALRDSELVRAGERTFEFGDRIRVVARWGNNETTELFRGYIGQSSLDITPNTNGRDHEGEGFNVYGPEILSDMITKIDYLTDDYEDELITNGVRDAGVLFPHDADGVFLTEGEVVFNPGKASNGENGNATPEDDQGFTYFMHPGRILRDASGDIILQSEPWTAYTAGVWLIHQIEADFNAMGLSLDQGFGALKDTLDAIPISTVKVTGLTAVQALAKVLNPIGYGFYIGPGSFTLAGGARAHFLFVYKLGGEAPVPGPWMADRLNAVAMNAEDGQRVQVQSIRFNRAANQAFNDWTITGDFKRVEVQLEWSNRTGANFSHIDLQPFWDDAVDNLNDFDVGGEINAFTVNDTDRTTWDARYNRDGTAQRRHAFRSFVWNEDGGLAPLVTVIPDIDTFGTANGDVIRRPRPMLPSLVYDEDDEQVKRRVRVEMAVGSFDNLVDETSWIPVPAKIWRDRAGFTLTSSNLLTYFPYKDNDLNDLEYTYGDFCMAQLLFNRIHNFTGTNPAAQFRVQCSIETDERVVGGSSLQQESAWPFARKGVAFLPQRFRASDIDNGQGGDFDGDVGEERDDTAAAAAYAQARRQVSDDAVGNGSIILRGIDLVYNPGDAIAKTRGYEIDLTVNAGSNVKRAPTVVGVTYDFREGAIKTEILLDTKIMARVR